MASDYSFDITCDYDHQEMTNAIDQTQREIQNRFDFKGVLVEIEYKDKDNILELHTDSDYKIQAILDIIESKMVKRGLDLKILDKSSEPETASGGTVRQSIILRSGFKSEDAKKISKMIRDEFPKSKPLIQGEEIRVTSKSKDELQDIMNMLRGSELEMPLQFGNYR